MTAPVMPNQATLESELAVKLANENAAELESAKLIVKTAKNKPAKNKPEPTEVPAPVIPTLENRASHYLLFTAFRPETAGKIIKASEYKQSYFDLTAPRPMTTIMSTLWGFLCQGPEAHENGVSAKTGVLDEHKVEIEGCPIALYPRFIKGIEALFPGFTHDQILVEGAWRNLWYADSSPAHNAKGKSAVKSLASYDQKFQHVKMLLGLEPMVGYFTWGDVSWHRPVSKQDPKPSASKMPIAFDSAL